MNNILSLNIDGTNFNFEPPLSSFTSLCVLKFGLSSVQEHHQEMIDYRECFQANQITRSFLQGYLESLSYCLLELTIIEEKQENELVSNVVSIVKTCYTLFHQYRAQRDKIDHPNDYKENFQHFQLAFDYLKKYPILTSTPASGRGLPLFTFVELFEYYIDTLDIDDQNIAYEILSKAEYL